MTVSVLIPYRPDGAARDRIWDWVRRRYELLLPEAELVVSGDLGASEFLNRGQARNLAAEKATGDVYVIGDADTAFDADALRAVIADVTTNGGWAVPRVYHQLSERQTRMLLGASPRAPIVPTDTDWSGEDSSVAPVLVVPAAAFHEVGGYDERYPGWGSDDRSLCIVLDTLYAPHKRYQGSVYHLWHPRSEMYDTGAELTLRYIEADGDVGAVRALREGHLIR